MTRFRIVPARSRVEIEARSTLHPIRGEADGVVGNIEATLEGGRIDMSVPPAAHVELEVARLRSGNALNDREMRRRIDATRYPMISAELRETKDLGAGRYGLRLDLTFHGVTRDVETEAVVQIVGGRLMIVGEHTVDVRRHDVAPPRILMLRVHPEVKVRLHLEAEPE